MPKRYHVLHFSNSTSVVVLSFVMELSVYGQMVRMAKVSYAKLIRQLVDAKLKARFANADMPLSTI
jgi:hypothetical protein